MSTAPAANPKSARPGTKAPAAAKPKKEKVVKIAYPHEQPLTEYPADFNPKLHLPLKKKDFADSTLYYTKLADVYEARAKALREKAAEEGKLGSVKDKALAKRLIAMTKRMAEMKAAMSAEGIDVDDILASVGLGKKETADQTQASAAQS